MKLEKLTITAFEDDEFTIRSSDFDPFEVLINPETYSRAYETEGSGAGNDKVMANGEIADQKIIEPKPECLSLDFWFDGTGAIPGSKDVFTQIENLKDVGLRYNGKIHSANFIMINWGKLVFKGQMTSLDVDYQLFKPDGTPLRAKATAKFKQFVDAQIKEEKKGRNSPDLTHVRIVKAGDTLPLMCFRIYKSSKYYIQVAIANKLSNFSDLKPGQQIYFPPLKR